jgi:hypothetical protein
MQMLFASLLRIRGALNMFAITHGMDPEFPPELERLADQNFWAKLITLEGLVRPLAAASFLMEKNSCTMADCVHIYAVLSISYKDEPRCIAEVEKRWNALEHPLFLLAYLLHPKYNGTARKLLRTIQNSNGKHFFDISRMIQCGRFYFKRYFPTIAASGM